ncbi:MAG: ribonuclease HII [Caulobacterales bacterium]
MGAPTEWTCGIDEAGRGPLAGPVVAAAVILRSRINGLADSKVLTAEKRETLALRIQTKAYFGIGLASVEEIDELNIWGATMLAMKRALEALPVRPVLALVDGNLKPKIGCEVQAIVKGDATVPAISAASILAKTHRDALMIAMDDVHPGYGFAQHKGYGAPAHMAALDRLGPCIAHRRSFAPIRERLEARASMLVEA